MLARSFLIESSSKLLVTKTGIKARLSSILGRIRPLILELLALEWRKFHTFELEYLWSQLAYLDQFLCVASLGWEKGCIRFWGRLTLAHWTQVSDRCPLGYLLTPLKLNRTLLSMDFCYWSRLRMRVIGRRNLARRRRTGTRFTAYNHELRHKKICLRGMRPGKTETAQL